MSAAKSQRLLETAHRVMPGGVLGSFTMPEESNVVIDRGFGCLVRDADGREYIDYILGSGPMILGHTHPRVVEAVKDQLDRGTQFYVLNEQAIELADKLVSAIPCAGQVKFTSTGAEATFQALRIARAYTRRDKILRFRGSYHGHHDYGMVGASAGIPAAVNDLVLTADFNDTNGTIAMLERHSADIAAVIVEPIQRATLPAVGFLESLRKVTRALGVLLVFDEIVTGFRLAWGGAQERYGVVPDLATYGKIIGGGLPLAAVAGRADIMEVANPRRRGEQHVYFSGTLNGNPLAASAGLATLAILQESDIYGRIGAVGAQLQSGLRGVAAESDTDMRVLGDPSMIGIAFSPLDDPYDPQTTLGADVRRRATLERELARLGILTNLGAKLYLSSEHQGHHVEATLDAFTKALRAVE
jgi:glutamate-1-semialdehyde 2,1-aminomutase